MMSRWGEQNDGGPGKWKRWKEKREKCVNESQEKIK
jgi:hypothetical protein